MSDSAVGVIASDAPVATHRLKQLISIGIALTSERDLSRLLERIVGEARQLANAEAGVLFLRDGDVLRFAVANNDGRLQRAGEHGRRRCFAAEPLALSRPSLPGYVALTGRLVNLPSADARAAGADDEGLTSLLRSQTGSLLMVPLQEPKGEVIGVLQLINARDAVSAVTPFEPELEGVMQALASQAAVAIRNARLEELSFKDPLTGVYNRRYFAVRIEEEGKRHVRFGEPLALVLIDLDRFKSINDEFGHHAGDDTLREVARLIAANSRSFSVVTRYGGDEFAVLLVNTPKSRGVTYARRIKDVIERHRFAHGTLTVSVGIAALPDDVTTANGLLAAADRALYAAKRLGRNLVESA